MAVVVTITAERETVVDFTIPYWEEPSGVLIRRPDEGSEVLKLLKPLQWSVWVTVILLFLLSSCVMYAYTVCTNRLSTRQRDRTMTSFRNCLWYSFSALVNQGNRSSTLRFRVFICRRYINVYVPTHTQRTHAPRTHAHHTHARMRTHTHSHAHNLTCFLCLYLIN